MGFNQRPMLIGPLAVFTALLMASSRLSLPFVVLCAIASGLVNILATANFVWQCLLAFRAARGWHPDALLALDRMRRWGKRLISGRAVAGSSSAAG